MANETVEEWRAVPANDNADLIGDWAVWRYRKTADGLRDDEFMGWYADKEEAEEAANKRNALERDNQRLRAALDKLVEAVDVIRDWPGDTTAYDEVMVDGGALDIARAALNKEARGVTPAPPGDAGRETMEAP